MQTVARIIFYEQCGTKYCQMERKLQESRIVNFDQNVAITRINPLDLQQVNDLILRLSLYSR